MASKSVLAEDTSNGLIVHIEEITEGYAGCVCATCGAPMVAANHNRDSRKLAIYFRHSGAKNCSLETALHQYAKQVLMQHKRVLLPDFSKRLRKDDDNGISHAKRYEAPGSEVQLDHVRAEKALQLGTTRVVPDISAMESGRQLYI